MRTYLENLITEKGASLEDTITSMEKKGHCGLTWKMLIDFICQEEMKEYHSQIRSTLVAIDFKNGDVFHYLNFLTEGMIKSLGFTLND